MIVAIVSDVNHTNHHNANTCFTDKASSGIAHATTNAKNHHNHMRNNACLGEYIAHLNSVIYHIFIALEIRPKNHANKSLSNHLVMGSIRYY